MNVWLWCALVLLLSIVPTGIITCCLKTEDRLAGLEMTGVLVTLELVLLAEGFGRTFLYDIPLTLAILSFGSGMVFARFVQRWL